MVSKVVDLLLWPAVGKGVPSWSFGKIGHLSASVQSASAQLADWAKQSRAGYLLLWSLAHKLPDAALLTRFIEDGVDLAHCGLKQGMGELLPSLQLIKQDWSMINGPSNQPISSWRLSLDACLIRRELIRQVDGIDAAFISREAAGLDLGLRCLNLGALVEHRPELWYESNDLNLPELPLQDLYAFVLRHYGKKWTKYVLVRRGLRDASCLRERRCYRRALRACLLNQAKKIEPVWFHTSSSGKENLERVDVSVIIPTLGRYPYLPDALASLRRQTIKPREVLVVDQNPPEQRQPQIYEGYEDLNLRVIWQDERGQSLARNTGLAAATSAYVFLFDDDSVAYDDLIEAHLRYVVNGRFQISTGVACPPPPSKYELSAEFRYPRVAQTFDTGNSLLSLVTAKELGGLDRNYDYGPGTDLDFGTRLYLAGQRIVHNPGAVRIHFKAPIGGLRVYNAHKYNTDTAFFRPFPAITQSYYGLRFLSKQQRRERTLLQFATTKVPVEFRRGNSSLKQMLKTSINFGGTCLLLPIKWYFSKRKAGQLLEKGARLAVFESKPKPMPLVAGQPL